MKRHRKHRTHRKHAVTHRRRRSMLSAFSSPRRRRSGGKTKASINSILNLVKKNFPTVFVALAGFFAARGIYGYATTDATGSTVAGRNMLGAAAGIAIPVVGAPMAIKMSELHKVALFIGAALGMSVQAVEDEIIKYGSQSTTIQGNKTALRLVSGMVNAPDILPAGSASSGSSGSLAVIPASSGSGANVVPALLQGEPGSNYLHRIAIGDYFDERRSQQLGESVEVV
jgi:hypothetical protein